ncbi:MAG: PAS domain-containing protein, partial [Gemmatimonadales bacterium]
MRLRTQSLLRFTDRAFGPASAGSSRLSGAGQYVLAAGVVGLVLVLKALPPGLDGEAPAVLLTAAVLVAALAGGLGPGVFAASLSLAGVLLFFPPDDNRSSLATLVFMVAFVAESALVILLAALTRRAVARSRGDLQRRLLDEAARARTEERLHVAQTAASMGTWEWDLIAQQLIWSDGMEALHGLPPGTLPSGSAEYLELVHPDDRQTVTDAVAGSRSDGRFDVRYRIVVPGGENRWLSGKGQV